MQEMQCVVVGLGAWGPGFNNWDELKGVFRDEKNTAELKSVAPKPQVIPANERRRAPLPVKIAVEVSSQALAQSGFDSNDVACVFGSGLGDTEITDYMCRTLTSELKQLSPTKFHNSVHNAAVGYWTISSGCMKSANSIAAYQRTAGVALLEAFCLCHLHQEPVLITLFDTQAHEVYQDIFATRESFASAMLICPSQMALGKPVIAELSASTSNESSEQSGAWFNAANPALHDLFITNPAAKILPLLERIGAAGGRQTYGFETSENSILNIDISR